MKNIYAIILGLTMCFATGCTSDPCCGENCVEKCQCLVDGTCCCEEGKCKIECDCEGCECKELVTNS